MTHALIAPAVLAVTLTALAWLHRGGRRRFDRFRGIEDSADRRRTYLRWAAHGCLSNLGIPLVGLALLGRIDAMWSFPGEFAALAWTLPYFSMDDPTLLPILLIGLPLGSLLSIWIALRGPSPRARRGYDLTPMLPRNRAELLAILPLVINAGVSEEIYFRLYLPLLLVLCGVPDWAAFLIALAIFAAVHRYQGWLGIVLTGAGGAAFTLFYLGGWGLMLPILLHLMANLNALVLRPAVRLRFRPRTD
ncbi:membrane protease YdiL (CAAX protease family) [Sphingomonas kyeonggiensis]|uniref:Membrane protease YdiL (CAAX protease family) n=1 Tax=Sphingomonas kyeonggiensis TaxID=1268553 RepID=A0A7W7JYQ0_9SPHN|nr:CPBP family intramembrane glutamic endopeptidase [Sphingomonas kyeonggiensis]MBB4837546.1 membrane protease YdiL (CAAX protease family) [Sphingomonas kyeonggiensis]